MAVKKSELYSLLWDACNKLRGGVEPSRYKDYVLVLLFFKYVSDRYKKSQSGRVYRCFYQNRINFFQNSLLSTMPLEVKKLLRALFFLNRQILLPPVATR